MYFIDCSILTNLKKKRKNNLKMTWPPGLLRNLSNSDNEAYQDEVVNHVMGTNGHEKCSGVECVKFKKKKIKNKNNKKNCVEPMEHEDIKHKRSHDDVEAGSGSDEDNKNNRKKSCD